MFKAVLLLGKDAQHVALPNVTVGSKFAVVRGETRTPTGAGARHVGNGAAPVVAALGSTQGNIGIAPHPSSAARTYQAEAWAEKTAGLVCKLLGRYRPVGALGGCVTRAAWRCCSAAVN